MRRTVSLIREVRQCRACVDGLPQAPRPVLQLGLAAPIVIAGQAPGRAAHQQGLPFADPSGVRLRQWLGVTEAEFYNPAYFSILPMGFCYPGTGSQGDLPPRPECAALWRPRLLAAHKGVQLTLVIGQYAQRWHNTVGDSVTERVRQWRLGWPAQLPLPHPSPRNNRWLTANPWFTREVLPVLQRRVQNLLNDEVTFDLNNQRDTV